MEKCLLCPRNCNVNRSKNEIGFCGAGAEMKIARAALHYWEEPCISGENGSGTVFFSGCNLRCVFCQNHKISSRNVGKTVSPQQLADIFADLEGQGANNINLVTPTHYVTGIIKALELARKRGLKIPVLYNCGGYESVSTLKMLNGYIDIYLPDFKYFNNKYGATYSKVNDYRERAIAAIDEMFSQVGEAEFDKNGIMKKGMIVRHLMLPGLLFDSKKIIDYLYNRYGNKIWISIMNQYTPLEQVSCIPELNRTVKEEHYEALLNYAAEIGVENAFVQEGGTVGESFIPDFDVE